VPTDPDDWAVDYGGLHESAGDLVAIIASLHFDSVVDRLLRRTKGNLFTVNELDRVGELDASREIRVAFNYVRMSEVGEEPHERSLPLTGGVFDVLVEVFQKNLVAAGAISQELANASSMSLGASDELGALQHQFDKAFKGKEGIFKLALLQARDYAGTLLARTWRSLRPPNFLTYHDVLRALLRADRQMTGGAHQTTIRECFAWREITLVPESMLLRPHTLHRCGLIDAQVPWRSSAGHSAGAGGNGQGRTADGGVLWGAKPKKADGGVPWGAKPKKAVPPIPYEAPAKAAAGQTAKPASAGARKRAATRSTSGKRTARAAAH
jgi:hypothetical protein